MTPENEQIIKKLTDLVKLDEKLRDPVNKALLDALYARTLLTMTTEIKEEIEKLWAALKPHGVWEE